MKIKFYKTPWIFKKILSTATWEKSTIEKKLYLTFDDGPTEEITAWVLDLLKEYNAKASFFCIGKNLCAQPNIAKRILLEGHTLANHTQHHESGWETSTKSYLESATKCQSIINQIKLDVGRAGKKNEKLFRPPYGKISWSQYRQLRISDFEIVMWDILSYDWLPSLDVNESLAAIKQKTINGSILVFHDSKKAENNLKQLLPETLEYFTDKGYRFTAL